MLEAAGLERRLQELLGHQQVKVQPYGRNFLIQMDLGESIETVARLTPLQARIYGAAFRSHTGRWDPLPDEGTRDEMIEAIVSQLGPYLTPENY
jgi:hypothetical protein